MEINVLSANERIYLRSLSTGMSFKQIMSILQMEQEALTSLREGLLLRFHCADELELGMWAAKNQHLFTNARDDLVKKSLEELKYDIIER